MAPAVTAFLRQAEGRSGSFASVGFDGYKQLTGYHRSDFSDWLYAANIPEAVVGLPLRNSLMAFAAAGLAALALSGILAFTSLAMLPALLFFTLAERQIVGGLQGAVKG